MTVRGKSLKRQESVFETGGEGAALLFTKWPHLICHLNGQYPFLLHRILTQQIVQQPFHNIKTLNMSLWLLSANIIIATLRYLTTQGEPFQLDNSSTTFQLINALPF